MIQNSGNALPLTVYSACLFCLFCLFLAGLHLQSNKKKGLFESQTKETFVQSHAHFSIYFDVPTKFYSTGRFCVGVGGRV